MMAQTVVVWRLTSLIIVSLLFAICLGDIYLSDVSVIINWNGNCSSDICSHSDPCQHGVIAYTNYENVPCNIFIMQENLNSDLISWSLENTMGSPTKIEVVSGAILASNNITVTTKGDLEIKGHFVDGWIQIQSPSDVTPLVTLLDSTLSRFPVMVNPGIAGVVVQNCVISGDAEVFTIASSESPHFNFINSTVTSDYLPSSVIFGGESLGNIALSQHTTFYVGLTLSSVPVDRILTSLLLETESSIIFNTGAARLSSTNLFEDIAMYSLTMRSSRIVGPMNGTATLGNSSTSITIIDSLLSNVDLSASEANSITINGSAFTDSHVYISSISPRFQNAPSIDTTTFFFARTPYANVTFVGSDYQPFYLHNVLIRTNDPEQEGGMLVLDAEYDSNIFRMDRDSSVTTHKLGLRDGISAAVSILNVKHSIEQISGIARSESSTWLTVNFPESEGNQRNNAVWTFDSITINGVSLNMTWLPRFDYRATSPTDGIIQIPAAVPTTIIPPFHMSVVWVNPLDEPTLDEWYPIASNFSQNASTITFFDFPLSDGQLVLHNFNQTSGQMQFKVSIDPNHIPSYNPVPTCPPPIPNGFICVNGQLVSVGDVTEPTILIPPNSGTVQVNGNLTTETIVFDGVGSTLNVSGCVSIHGGITIQLKGKDKKVPEGPLVLVIQNDGCTSSLLDIPVRIEEEKSCKKTKITQDGSATKSSLVVLMNVDSSSCKTRWIILGSVLGVVAVLSAIGAIVGKVLYDKKMKS